MEELSSVNKQIVSLDLNKMPVSDADIKKVGKFENLRKLSLNFTNITGKGLEELASLAHLQSLSLSGTQVTYQNLEQYLPAFKNLTKLTLWNKEINESEIYKLQNSFKHIQIISELKDGDNTPIKLNVPQLKNSFNIFRDSLQLKLGHPIFGVEIRFTLEGTEPDSVNSFVLTKKQR